MLKPQTSRAPAIALLVGFIIMSTGCNLTQKHAQKTSDPNRIATNNRARLVDEVQTVSFSDASAQGIIRPAAAIRSTIDEADSLELNAAHVAPVVTTSFLENSLSISDIEAIADNNNPTLQQIAAASQAAAGYRLQVGLCPNPTIGYQGVQLADKSTDQHTVFVEQEFVTRNKLASNQRVLNEAVRTIT